MAHNAEIDEERYGPSPGVAAARRWHQEHLDRGLEAAAAALEPMINLPLADRPEGRSPDFLTELAASALQAFAAAGALLPGVVEILNAEDDSGD